MMADEADAFHEEMDVTGGENEKAYVKKKKGRTEERPFHLAICPVLFYDGRLT